VYSDYERVLKQRNTLLRTARQTGSRATALSTLDAWDAQLVGYGTEIIVARTQLIERLRPLLTQAYQAIAETNNEPRILVRSSLFASAASATFESSDDESDLGLLETSDRELIQQAFKTKLSEIRPRELERGITLIGPHRDDLLLMLGTLPAKGYASHGECWSFALGLRLASIDLLRNETQSGDPILILDDVFAELDSGRRTRLAQLVANNEQVLITAAVAEDVPETLHATTFHVKHGTVAADEPVPNDD
jgi:DNA replication and repair protein RecF